MTRTPDDDTMHPRPERPPAAATACGCAEAPGCVHETPAEQRLAEAILGGNRVAPADPDRPCYHPAADVFVSFGRIGEEDDGNPTPGMPTSFVIEVTLACQACAEPFVFDGVPAGLSFDAPSTSVDGRELRAPVRPASLPPRHRRRGDTGGFRGFRINVAEQPDEPGAQQ